MAWSSRTLPLVMKVLVIVGLYCANQGQRAQAAGLLALVCGHEAAESDIRDKAHKTLAALGLERSTAPARPLEEWIDALDLLL